MNVNSSDARAFVRWLSNETGAEYRLLSEAEWEYTARAGTTTARNWGNWPNDACEYANVHDQTSKAKGGWFFVHECRDGYTKTAPAGKFRPNNFGLYDTLGNVWEWVEDCWNNSYSGAPSDGSAWTLGDCKKRILRGGSWLNLQPPRQVRSANRLALGSDNQNNYVGFRVARTLP